MKVELTENGIRIGGRNVQAVRLCDYSAYEPDMGSNGGAYGFWETMRFQGGKAYRTYGTTAEFPYCPYCGTFGSCYCYEPQAVNAVDALRSIVCFASKADGDSTFLEVEF